MRPTLALALFAIALPACSSAPAKDVPPIADEVNTISPIDKPEPPVEEVYEEEPDETPEAVAPTCDNATLVTITAVAASDPEAVMVDKTEQRLWWSGDLNSDELDDVIVRDDESCTDEICSFAIYVQCAGGYFEAMRVDQVKTLVPRQASEGGEWAEIEIIGIADGDEEPATDVMKWGDTGFSAQ